MDADHTHTGAVTVDGWGAEPHRGLYLALLLVSMALLTLEVSLTRFFSFTVWYHFAYLTISMALLGFGSSGALVASFPRLFARNGHTLLVTAVTTAAVLTIAGLVFLARFPLDVSHALTDPIPFLLSLFVYYVVVGLPFLLAGLSVSVPFAVYPQLMGRLYFWDLLGAALGCVTAVALIERLGVPGLIISSAGLMLAAAAMLGVGTRIGGRRGPLLAAALVCLLLAGPLGEAIPIAVTNTKQPATRVPPVDQDVYTKWTALNRVDAGGWDHPTRIQYWVVALKKGYEGPYPTVARLTYDGSNGSAIYSYSGSLDEYAMLEHHLLRTPYLTQTNPRVLVIGVGGGIDMMNAIKQGARHVTGVELQPQTVYLLKEHLRDFTGGFYERPDVNLVAGEGRHFVRKTDEIFDIVQVTAVDTFAAQATGAYVLAESYLYTVEALEDDLAHVTDTGLVSLVVGDFMYPDTLPPLGTRLGLIGYRALERSGITRPSDHLMVVGAVNPKGNAITQNILVKKAPFSADEVATITAFCEANGFRVLYTPARHASGELPLSTILGPDEGARAEVLERAWFRMDAVYDSDPFFYNVAKWSNFSPQRSLFFMAPGSFLGQLVLVMMVAQSTLLGIVLIVFPLLRGAREGLKAPGLMSYLAYFLALGMGFMFIEISFVQSFVLFLGSPTYALSVTIFALLLFSSLGSLISTRFVAAPEAMIRRLMLVIATLVLVYAFSLERVFGAFLHLDLPARIAVAVLAQVPIGLTLGMFMPLGITCISREHPRLVPWAWGINGVGSVVGTTLAVIFAMSWGFTIVALSAALMYVVGASLLLRAQGRPRPA